jgi:clan AA aspartic protease
MISGTVTAREPIVRLTVRGPGGKQAVDAVVDTGFTEQLTLPTETIAALDLPPLRESRALLADGSEITFDIYEAVVHRGNEWRRIPVAEADSTPLIGMGLLEGCELCVEVREGGRVLGRRGLLLLLLLLLLRRGAFCQAAVRARADQNIGLLIGNERKFFVNVALSICDDSDMARLLEALLTPAARLDPPVGLLFFDRLLGVAPGVLVGLIPAPVPKVQVRKAERQARLCVKRQARMQKKPHVAVVADRPEIRVTGLEQAAVRSVVDLGGVLDGQDVPARTRFGSVGAHRLDERFEFNGLVGEEARGRCVFGAVMGQLVDDGSLVFQHATGQQVSLFSNRSSGRKPLNVMRLPRQ